MTHYDPNKHALTAVLTDGPWKGDHVRVSLADLLIRIDAALSRIEALEARLSALEAK